MKIFFRYLAVAISISFLLPKPAQAAAGNDNPTGPAGQFSGNITTAGSYTPYTGNATRAVEDLSVAGSIGAYPLNWTRVLNTRRPTGWDGLGRGGWTHSYDWRVSVRTSTGGHPEHWNDANEDEVYEGDDATVFYPDGRVVGMGGNPTEGFAGVADDDQHLR